MAVAQPREEDRSVHVLQLPQGIQVEMIVMVVAHQHGVDARQCVEGDAGRVTRRGPAHCTGLARSE